MEPAARLATIRQLVSRGVLPTVFAQLWGGPGTGTACAACGVTIVRPKYEFECVAANGVVIHLCQPCIAAWDAARRDELHAAS